MRLSTACLIGVAMAATPLISTTAVSAYPDRAGTTLTGMILADAHNCPAGQHWEESGYVAEGKWRDAHCAKDGGRE
jgi:hypothetical protein